MLELGYKLWEKVKVGDAESKGVDGQEGKEKKMRGGIQTHPCLLFLKKAPLGVTRFS